MTITLQRGQRISLFKEAPGLTQITCCLGWDEGKKSGGGFFSAFGGTQNFDLDASVLCLDRDNRITDIKDIVYFGNLEHQSRAIIHQGDNLTGDSDGDDEVIVVDLPKIPARISRLVFVVNIYDCIQRKQDFSQVENAFVRLVNRTNNKELARYELSGNSYAGMTGMILAEIYRHNNEWKMAAIGNGFKVEGLKDIAANYA